MLFKVWKAIVLCFNNNTCRCRWKNTETGFCIITAEYSEVKDIRMKKMLFTAACVVLCGASLPGADVPDMEIQGKEAVIQRIKNLFESSAAPIIQTRDFKPAKPYMSVHKIPPKDNLTPGRAVIVYKLRFVDAKDAQDAIEGIVGENGTVEVSKNQNLIIINVEDTASKAVENALLALDQPLPQVLVETQIVEVQREQGEARDVGLNYTRTDAVTGNSQSFGMNMSSPGQKITDSKNSAGFNIFPIDVKNSSGDTESLRIALQWLETSTDAKILASPNIIADLNSEAVMKTGEEIPYNEAAVTNTAVTNNFKFKKTGINLRIKPVLINSDTVRLEIQPEINLLLRYDEFPQTGSETTIKVPVVSIRSISTQLTAADGEVIMLGGLYSSERSERLRKTPFLSDIPLIGELFTGKDYTMYDKQLLFFMKIHILQTPYSVITDPEANAEMIRKIGDSVGKSPAIFKGKEPPKQKNSTDFLSFLLGDDDPVVKEKKEKKEENAENPEDISKLQGK